GPVFPPLEPACSGLAAELVARVAAVLPAEVRHPLGVREQPLDVDAHQRCRHDAERRQCGVAAADARLPGEDAPEIALLRHALQLRAGIRDRDEARAALA